jgi:hypothetical protein
VKKKRQKKHSKTLIKIDQITDENIYPQLKIYTSSYREKSKKTPFRYKTQESVHFSNKISANRRKKWKRN